MDSRSIRDRLLEKGYVVTNNSYPKFRTDKRMITKNGEELGFYAPLEALDKFIECDKITKNKT